MKILIVTAEFGVNAGGLSLSCQKLYELLSLQNDVDILDSTARPIDVIPGGYSIKLPKAVSLEYKLKTDALEFKNYDVVIGFGGGFNGYYASLLSRKLNARFILSLRGTDVNLAKWSCEDSHYLQQALSTAEKVVCLSNEMADNILLQDKYASYKLTVIPNSMAECFTPIKFVNLPKEVVIGCAASHLNEKKGIANLLRMVSEFKLRYTIPITLQLVGDIDDDLKKGYKILIQKLDINENVKFIEKTNREELSEIMKCWDFYIQTSVCEGHPNSITEAFQEGVAFISSKTGFLAEQLEGEFPIFFFNNFNPSSMAEHLKALIDAPNKEEIYAEALNVLRQSCNEKDVEQMWLNILKNEPLKHDLDIEQILSVGLHEVSGMEHDSITTPVEVFREFVYRIYNAGYGLCSMKKYLNMDSEERKHWIVCTFDDGYDGLKKYAYPILRKYGFTATVFVCTDLIGKDNSWNNKDGINRQHLTFTELDELHKGGWEIASHGVHHYNLLKLSDDGIQHELGVSKKFIKNRWHYAETYAYPYGAYNDFIKSCVGQYFKYAFAVTKGGTSLIVDKLQIRRYSITEIYKMLSIIP